MPLAAIQLALCVFPTERLDKGSDDHRVHTRVHLLRGMYLLSIGSARNTHLYTLMSTFTHTLGGSREREPQHARHSSYVRSCARIQLGTIVAFRQVLIYLGWACSIWKHPQQLTDRETKKFQSSGAKKLSSDLVIMAQLSQPKEGERIGCLVIFPLFTLTLPRFSSFFVPESFICVIHSGLFKVTSLLLFPRYWTWNPNQRLLDQSREEGAKREGDVGIGQNKSHPYKVPFIQRPQGSNTPIPPQATMALLVFLLSFIQSPVDVFCPTL